MVGGLLADHRFLNVGLLILRGDRARLNGISVPRASAPECVGRSSRSVSAPWLIDRVRVPRGHRLQGAASPHDRATELCHSSDAPVMS